jgi:hypothetical protein
MGLDLWFREDVARILASAYETMQSSADAVPSASPETAETYQRGFGDALRAVAVAFGVAAPTVRSIRQEWGPPERTGSRDWR